MATTPGVATCTSKVAIRITCRGLAKLDLIAKNNPMVVLYEKSHQEWKEKGRTEVVFNSLDPTFMTPIIIDYNFECIQQVRAVCIDFEGDQSLNYIGEYLCKLSEICATHNKTVTRDLVHDVLKTKRGTITFSTDEIHEHSNTLRFQLSGSDLKKKNMFGLVDPDPYIEIFTQTGSEWFRIHTTEIVKSNVNPAWMSFTLSEQELCGGDRTRNLQFNCYDGNKLATQKEIGSFETSVMGIIGKTSRFPLIHKEMAKKKGLCRLWHLYYYLSQTA